MLKPKVFFVLTLLAPVFSLPAFAGPSEGRIGVGVHGGVNLPILDKRIREITTSGLNMGFLIRYGLSSHWEGTFGVEHLNAPAVDVTPVLFGGQYTFLPEAKLSPVARASLGLARVHGVGGPTDMDERFAFKPGIGLEYAWCPSITVGAFTDLFWSPQAEPNDKIFGAFVGGLQLTYFFGQVKP